MDFDGKQNEGPFIFLPSLKFRKKIERKEENNHVKNATCNSGAILSTMKRPHRSAKLLQKQEYDSACGAATFCSVEKVSKTTTNV